MSANNVRRFAFRSVCESTFYIGLSSIFLSACAFYPRDKFEETAFAFNSVIERSQNEMLLLNIVRAKERRPMYFTAISAFRGNISSTVTTGNITIPFGPGSTDVGSAQPSLSYSANPTFDLAILDSKNFTRGILTPVPLDTLKYYWDQGWPKELLLHLFIRTIEVEGAAAGRFDNYPGDIKSLGAFQEKLKKLFNCVYDPGGENREFKLCNLELEHDKPGVEDYIGKEIADVSDLKALVEVKKADLNLVVDDAKKYHLVGKKQGVHLRINNAALCVTGTALGPDRTAISFASALKSTPNETCSARLYIRSPEAMLYYLGEILRAELAPNAEAIVDKLSICATGVGSHSPLFFGARASSHGLTPIVSVEFEGSTYTVPRKALDQDNACSMHTLSLIAQLIGQQKDSSELPVTGVVNVVGPTIRQ